MQLSLPDQANLMPEGQLVPVPFLSLLLANIALLHAMRFDFVFICLAANISTLTTTEYYHPASKQPSQHLLCCEVCQAKLLPSLLVRLLRFYHTCSLSVALMLLLLLCDLTGIRGSHASLQVCGRHTYYHHEPSQRPYDGEAVDMFGLNLWSTCCTATHLTSHVLSKSIHSVGSIRPAHSLLCLTFFHHPAAAAAAAAAH